MELSEFVGQPCKTQLAFEFFPKKPVSLGLQKVAAGLKKSKLLVDFETPVFVGVVVDATSVSIFRNGKILVKDTKDKIFAQKIAEKILSAIKSL